MPPDAPPELDQLERACHSIVLDIAEGDAEPTVRRART
jgi:hypothetical protein